MSAKQLWWPAIALALLLPSLCPLTAIAQSEDTGRTVQEVPAAADTASSDGTGWLMLPVVFYTPETKLAGGVSAMYYFRPESSGPEGRPSNISAMFIYTARKQYMSMLPFDFYWNNERNHLIGMVSYNKYPDFFYGIGNDTAEEDEEEFTPRTALLELRLERALQPSFYCGLRYEFAHQKMLEVAPDGMLASGMVLGSQGGTISGLGLNINWDGRDNVFFPETGHVYILSAMAFTDALGSDYNFLRYQLDLRRYYRLAPGRVLAVQGFAQIMGGDPPFQMLSLLGGQNMLRGHYFGRYRDKNMVVMQAEYRWMFWKWLGLAAFAGVGDVASHVDRFHLDDFKYSYGGGLRIRINQEEKINLRLDFGYGENTSGMYFTYVEAF